MEATNVLWLGARAKGEMGLQVGQHRLWEGVDGQAR